ncbi:MAG: hypothetical protein RIF37_15075 [Rhodospirillaceae bacterium]
MSTRKSSFWPILTISMVISSSILLNACVDPRRVVGQGVKDWCKRDTYCGRQGSDPSQVPTAAPPSRDNPSGAPR